MKYLDESGFCLCLPPTYAWTLKGRAYQHRVKTRWGSKGRINLIGALRVEGESKLLEYEMLEERCRTKEVVDYLDILAAKAEEEAKPVVVALDNAPFHRAGVLQAERAKWESKGLRLYYLPAYCPHLNPIEGVWKRLKGFLMPRRFYDTLAELKEAVLSALRLLGAVEVHSQLGGT